MRQFEASKALAGSSQDLGFHSICFSCASKLVVFKVLVPHLQCEQTSAASILYTHHHHVLHGQCDEIIERFQEVCQIRAVLDVWNIRSAQLTVLIQPVNNAI